MRLCKHRNHSTFLHHKIGYAGFFPLFFFFFCFPFFLFLTTELRKQRHGSPISSRKPNVWNSMQDANFISFFLIFFPFSYLKDIWRQVPYLRLDFLLHALAWWPNSCLSIWSNFSWPLNRLSDDFFLKAKVLEVFQPGAYRSTGRFKAWGLGKLHLKLLISYGTCKEHENKKNFVINSFCSWIYVYVYIYIIFFLGFIFHF